MARFDHGKMMKHGGFNMKHVGLTWFNHKKSMKNVVAFNFYQSNGWI
jgi:hypothetical protein